MNSKELESNLTAVDIPKESYSLSGGLFNEVYCLGQAGAQWEVYYSERGNKTSLKIFLNEEDACQYFYRWVTSSLG
ncbi:MAG: hypothetical protein WCC10_15375 [Tumebacillaceae bacterium]